MSNKQIVNVKVNVGDVLKKKASKPRKARKQKPAGDTVVLREGNVPARKRPGLHVRFLSPGSAFGGGLPVPLNSASYASAPPVAQPLGRMDFINSGGSADYYYFNRGRDRRDDIPIEANPSNIRADVSPSVRAVPNSNAVESPDMGLALSRAFNIGVENLALEKASSSSFEGEQPRIGGANLRPSVRAEPSQPASGSAELLRYKPQQEYVPPPASLAEVSSSSASANQPGRDRMTSPIRRRPKEETQYYSEESLYGPPKQKREAPVNPQSLRRGGSVF